MGRSPRRLLSRPSARPHFTSRWTQTNGATANLCPSMQSFSSESPRKTCVRVERMHGGKVLPDLWTLALRFQSNAERRRSFSQLARLAATVPIWNLYARCEVEKLEEVVFRLVKTCSQQEPKDLCPVSIRRKRKTPR